MGFAAGLAEFFGGVCGGVGFVDEVDGEVGEGGGELVGEVADFLSGGAF